MAKGKQGNRSTCTEYGHNFVESRLGSSEDKVSYIFCTKCGELKQLKPLRGED
jgi:hypothetical protein